MALASYANLTAAIADELHRSDLTTPIADFVLRGEKRIHREVRATEMEAPFSGAIAGGVVAVPTGFLSWKTVYIDSNGANILQPKTLEWIYANYPIRTASGLPKFIARGVTSSDGGTTVTGQFEFGPYPDSTYTVTGVYYRRLTTVSSSWNALATNNPDLYLYAALTQASAYARDDDQIAKWEAAYQVTKDAINAEAIGLDLGDMPLRVTPR